MAELITASKIRSKFPANEYPRLRNRPIIIADRNYFIPSTSWIFGTFSHWFKAQLNTLNVAQWKTHFDCDDFSRGFAWLASVCHGYGKTSMSEGIAIGELFYFVGGIGSKGHAINCAIVNDGELIFIEPNGVKEIILTPVEKASITFIRF